METACHGKRTAQYFAKKFFVKYSRTTTNHSLDTIRILHELKPATHYLQTMKKYWQNNKTEDIHYTLFVNNDEMTKLYATRIACKRWFTTFCKKLYVLFQQVRGFLSQLQTTREKGMKHVHNTKMRETRSVCRGFTCYFAKQISCFTFVLFRQKSSNFAKHKGIFLWRSGWNQQFH